MAVAQEHWAAKWIHSREGHIPPDAFRCHDKAIARARFKGGLHIGYVSHERRGCVIGWGGEEHCLPEYEVLTGDQSQFRWVKSSGQVRPQFFIPLKAGHEADHNQELYIAKIHNHIGKAGKHLMEGASYPCDGREVTAHDYEVLAFLG
ncbi:10423_t:CDS:2 [Diversispora eburnea]|uniref:10423_t:CDS:1 n=1 Tax=Diversispora eburnea TaxID=1213867 RepID=A0A9N8YIC3_9GLOM|nr:10423_t:CDS:2 [Diversispora eburnea]